VIKEAARVIVDRMGMDYFIAYFQFREAKQWQGTGSSGEGGSYKVNFDHWVKIKDYVTVKDAYVMIGTDNSISVIGIPNLLEDHTKGMPYNIDEDDAIRIASTIFPSSGFDGYHASFYFYGGNLTRYVWSVRINLTDPKASTGESRSVIIDPYSGMILMNSSRIWMSLRVSDIC
jgi:hypothetical protein